MIDSNWFFFLVLTLVLASAPVLGCLWWIVTSRIRDRRRARIAERMSATYDHPAHDWPGREKKSRASRRAAAPPPAAAPPVPEPSQADAAGERNGNRAPVGARRPEGERGGPAWPAEETDLVEPVRCNPRQVAEHDGECDCWEDTEVFELRNGLPAAPLRPRAPRRPAATQPPTSQAPTGQPPRRPVDAAQPPNAQPPRRPTEAAPPGPPPRRPVEAAQAGPPPRRPVDWRQPERSQQRPVERNPVERRQRPPVQRRERYPAERRDGRPAQRPDRRPVERAAVRQPAQWPPAEPPDSGRHRID